MPPLDAALPKGAASGCEDPNGAAGDVDVTADPKGADGKEPVVEELPPKVEAGAANDIPPPLVGALIIFDDIPNDNAGAGAPDGGPKGFGTLLTCC